MSSDDHEVQCDETGCSYPAAEGCPKCTRALCAHHFLGPQPKRLLHAEGTTCPGCAACIECDEKATKWCTSCDRWLCDDDYFGTEQERHEAIRQVRCRTCASPDPVP